MNKQTKQLIGLDGLICFDMDYIEYLEDKIHSADHELRYLPINKGKKLNLQRNIKRWRIKLATKQMQVRDSLGIHYDLVVQKSLWVKAKLEREDALLHE